MGSNSLLLFVERNKVAQSNLILKIGALGNALCKNAFVSGPLQRDDFEKHISLRRGLWIGSKERSNRANGLRPVDYGKAIYLQPLALCIGTVKIVHLKALAVGSQAIIQVEEVFWFIADSRQNLVINLSGALVITDIGCDEGFAVRRVQCCDVSKADLAIVCFKRCIHLARKMECDVNYLNSRFFILSG